MARTIEAGAATFRRRPFDVLSPLGVTPSLNDIGRMATVKKARHTADADDAGR